MNHVPLRLGGTPISANQWMRNPARIRRMIKRLILRENRWKFVQGVPENLKQILNEEWKLVGPIEDVW